MTEKSKSPKVDFGCMGCVGSILALIFIWALVFGWNVDGKHHELSCGSSGVTVE